MAEWSARVLACLFSAGLLLMARPAEAQPAQQGAAARTPPPPIAVDDARIAAGDLRISGRLRQGGAKVTLDNGIPLVADRNGRFVFRLTSRPKSCVAKLKSGDDERDVLIANCAPEAEPGKNGDQGPAGVPGKDGDQGPAGVPGRDGDQGPAGVPGRDGEQGPAGVPGKDGDQGPAGVPGKDGERGAKGDAGVSGAAGLAGAPGQAAASLRTLKAETCPGTGCEVACNAEEIFVSAYCLGSGSPVFQQGGDGKPSASCPSGSSGMVGICMKPESKP